MKKLKISEKTLSLLLAGTLSLTLTGCRGKVDMSSLTFDELMSIEDVQDSTQLDELAISNEYTSNYLEYADTLERYMDIVDILSDIDFTDVSKLKPLNHLEYLETTSLSMEEINELRKMACNDSNNLVDVENKIYALKKLNYLNDHCRNWISVNGKDISIKIMMDSVKASVMEEMGLGVDDFNFVTIPARTSFDSGSGNKYYIYVNGQAIEIADRAYEISNTIEYIYEMQNASLTADTEYESYRKSLNLAKTTIAAGASRKNGNITSRYNANYIEDNYIKR